MTIWAAMGYIVDAFTVGFSVAIVLVSRFSIGKPPDSRRGRSSPLDDLIDSHVRLGFLTAKKEMTGKLGKFMIYPVALFVSYWIARGLEWLTN